MYYNNTVAPDPNLFAISQVVLYETTNIIDIYIKEKNFLFKVLIWIITKLKINIDKNN